MPKAYRVMIRLSPELYAQLETRGSSGQPLAAIVRDALIQYLTEQPGAAGQQPQQPLSSRSAARAATEQPDALQEQLTALTASLQALHAQVDTLTSRVDALAAPQQPRAARSSRSAARAATEQPQQPQQPALDTPPRSTPASSCSASCAPVATSTTAPGKRSGGCFAMSVLPAMWSVHAKRVRRSGRAHRRACGAMGWCSG